MDATTDRRTQLLDSALTLLRTRGFSALTQTAVAEAAGIRQGLLTYYFPKRTDLLRGIAEHAAAKALPPPNPKQATPSALSPPDLASIRERLLDETADDGMPRLMLSLILMADEDEDVRRWMTAFQQGLIDQLDRLLRLSGHPVTRERLERLHATLIGLRIRRLMRLPGDDEARLRAMADQAFGEAVFAPFNDLKATAPSRARR